MEVIGTTIQNCINVAHKSDIAYALSKTRYSKKKYIIEIINEPTIKPIMKKNFLSSIVNKKIIDTPREYAIKVIQVVVTYPVNKSVKNKLINDPIRANLKFKINGIKKTITPTK